MNTTKTTCLSVFYTWFLTMVLLMSFSLSPAFAQNDAPSSKPKPQLVEIILNEETSDPKALEIAKKLAPTYFNLKSDAKNYNKYNYYADFFQYNQSRFLILRITDNFFLCSKLGCPIKIYKEQNNNEWRLLGEFLTYKLYVDINSRNSQYPNLILDGYEKVNGLAPPIFIWNLNKYVEINK